MEEMLKMDFVTKYEYCGKKKQNKNRHCRVPLQQKMIVS